MQTILRQKRRKRPEIIILTISQTHFYTQTHVLISYTGKEEKILPKGLAFNQPFKKIDI